jgi:hypothetical protein
VHALNHVVPPFICALDLELSTVYTKGSLQQTSTTLREHEHKVPRLPDLEWKPEGTFVASICSMTDCSDGASFVLETQ